MESQTAEAVTDTEEHRLDCLARYLIRAIRKVPPGDQREARFNQLLGKKHPEHFKEAMRARIRRLWRETNEADRAARQRSKGQRP